MWITHIAYATMPSQGLAVYCGEAGGERSAAPLLQVILDFALSLENGVKKYDNRVAAEKRRAAKKMKEAEKGKENNKRNVAPPVLSKKMLKGSSLQPHVGVTDKVNKANAASAGGQGRSGDSTAATKEECLQKSDSSSSTDSSAAQNTDPKQALLASIRSRRESLPPKLPPDGVPDRVRHINNTIGRKESRVLLVNRMLSEAPASVKQGEL